MLKTYAVIGDPIDHSMSPIIHNTAFRKLNMECTYIAYKIASDELDEGIDSLKKIDIAGFNVTIPHKVAIMKHLDVVDENCSIIGACNTVSNKNGVLRGYNTDMDGFMDPLRRREIRVRDSSVLLLGAGGAARAILVGLASADIGHITISNRSIIGAMTLASLADRLGLSSKHTKLNRTGSMAEYDIVINATSLGLRGEQSTLDFDTLQPNTIVYDIVYRPMNTDLILNAKKRGAKIIYGYEMLLGQAARAFEIWHGVTAPFDSMKRALLGGV